MVHDSAYERSLRWFCMADVVVRAVERIVRPERVPVADALGCVDRTELLLRAKREP